MAYVRAFDCYDGITKIQLHDVLNKNIMGYTSLNLYPVVNPFGCLADKVHPFAQRLLDYKDYSKNTEINKDKYNEWLKTLKFGSFNHCTNYWPKWLIIKHSALEFTYILNVPYRTFQSFSFAPTNSSTTFDYQATSKEWKF